MKVKASVKKISPGDYTTRSKGRLVIRNKKKRRNNQRQG